MAKAGQWDPKGGRVPSKDIVVDQVRDVVDRRLAMKRFEGRRRFVILDPADAMNPQAQNALLEDARGAAGGDDPGARRVEPRRALPTIRSRAACACRSRRSPPPPSPRGSRPPAGPRRGAPRGRALGRLAARALALDAETLAAEREAVLAAAALDPDDAVAWLAFAREHGDDARPRPSVCALLAVWLRDVLAAQAGAAGAGRSRRRDPPRRRCARAGRGPAPARGGPADGGGAPPERVPDARPRAHAHRGGSWPRVGERRRAARRARPSRRASRTSAAARRGRCTCSTETRSSRCAPRASSPSRSSPRRSAR